MNILPTVCQKTFLNTKQHIHSTVKNKKNILYKNNFLLKKIINTTIKKKNISCKIKKYINILNNKSYTNNYFHFIKNFIKNKFKISINSKKINDIYLQVKKNLLSKQKNFFSFIKNYKQCQHTYSQYETNQNVSYDKFKQIMFKTTSYILDHTFLKYLYKKPIKSKIKFFFKNIISCLYSFHYKKHPTYINYLSKIDKEKNIYIKNKFKINNLWKQFLKRKFLVSQLQKENESNFFFHDKNIGSIHIKIKLKNKDAILNYAPCNLENEKIFFLELQKLKDIFNNYGLLLRFSNIKNIKYIQKKLIENFITYKKKKVNVTTYINMKKNIPIDVLTYDKKKNSTIRVHFYA
ncbi:hypothetical protein [Buchnera aphidicola]|uniref:hypothetical protein n=1 Tax=Buchnera aphidicola TaxID=9 RepID=UPI003463C70F